MPSSLKENFVVRRFGSVRRRSVLAGLAGTGLFPKPLLDQGPLKSVGILVGQGSEAQGKWRVDAFRRGLMKYGWTDGQNIRVEYRWPEGDPIAAKQYAEELVAARADVLVATNHLPSTRFVQPRTLFQSCSSTSRTQSPAAWWLPWLALAQTSPGSRTWTQPSPASGSNSSRCLSRR